MTLFNELQDLMIKYRFRANRKLAQHFVVDQALLDELAALAGLKESDTVLEIGPGTGFLTRELLKKCRVFAVEKDESLCRLLEKEMPKKNFSLARGDFLEVPLPEFNKVVSLPPYSRSADIVHRLLQHGFDLAVLVFQKEFAEKLVAIPGFNEYCALTVLAQQSFDASIARTVSASSFFPKPKGESAIIVLRARKKPIAVKDKQLFTLFVKTLFRFRNKNLGNALQKSRQFLLPSLKLSKAEFGKRVSKLKNLEEKVDLLPVNDIAEAFNCLVP
ncbi:MAG: 16S rRNA (adenine(1518)-N(6)/adenine(1519)-N(6))-dimethyltransferase RsmA [archaeon]